jgi:signal peptidase I
MNATTHALNGSTDAGESRGKRFGAALRMGAISAGQALLRALWLVVIPMLLTGLTLRYLVPHAESAKATRFENDLARWGAEDPVTFAVVLFLVFAVLARYWRFYLPGGWLMAPLAPGFSSRIPRAELGEVSAAAELERSLARPKTRRTLEKRLEPKSLATLDAHLADVRAAIDAGDGGRARSKRELIALLVAPALRVQRLAQSAAFFGGVGVAILGAFYLRNNVFQSYRVLSDSMLPTLQPGDHVGGNKLAYGTRLPGTDDIRRPSTPRRGDVVVFRNAALGGDGGELVKRVIGLPGDHVTIYRGRPVINGWVIPSCNVGTYFYVNPTTGKPSSGKLSLEFLEDKVYLTIHTPIVKVSPEYLVKEGEVFVIGDNRHASRDSRALMDGGGRGVKASEVVARADHLVVHAKRSGEFDVRTFFQPLSALNLNLDNVTTSALETRIKTCLEPENRPKETSPKTRGAPGAAASPGARQ